MADEEIPTYEREPIYWFALLEKAVHRRDNSAARNALARLEQLGIEVRFTLPLELLSDDKKQKTT